MTVRNYAILYVGGKRTRGGTVVGGGTIVEGGNGVLDTEPHALAGVEHTSLDILNLPTAETDDALVLAPDGTGGVEFRAEAAGGGDVPWVYAQADGGLTGDGVTDDTAALQALIDSATAAGTQSAWIWFEPGIYLLSGALQDTGAFNGQIILPTVTTLTPGITITFEGPVRPYWHGYPEGDDGEAVLKSTLTGASGTAAAISGGNGIVNRVSVVIRNLRCVAPANPTFTFWNLSSTYEGLREGLLITSDGTLAQPTNSNAYGIRLPGSSIGSISIEQVWVIGFYTAVQTGELAYGHINAWYCIRALEIDSDGHLSLLTVEVLNCPYGIVPTAATYADIVVDTEHANTGIGQPAWTVNVADLYDPSDFLHGHIRWMSVEAGVGPDHTFVVDGGANSSNAEMGALAGGGGAPTTVDYLVGSAQAGLSAEIVVGTTPGGELGGTWASPTVDATHSGSAHVAILDGLSDVTITTPADADRLRYNGSAWVNSNLHWESMVDYDGLVMLDSAGGIHVHEVSH